MPVRKKTIKPKKKSATRKAIPAKRKVTTQRKTKKTKNTRKLTAKRPVRKPSRKVASKATPQKPTALKALKKAMTKSQLISHLAEYTGVVKKDVSALFESLETVLQAHVQKGAVGAFSLFGLAKFRVVRKPAMKKRKGINPFTGEPAVFKAKPARNVVKIRPLQKVKDMAA